MATSPVTGTRLWPGYRGTKWLVSCCGRGTEVRSGSCRAVAGVQRYEVARVVLWPGYRGTKWLVSCCGRGTEVTKWLVSCCGRGTEVRSGYVSCCGRGTEVRSGSCRAVAGVQRYGRWLVSVLWPGYRGSEVARVRCLLAGGYQGGYRKGGAHDARVPSVLPRYKVDFPGRSPRTVNHSGTLRLTWWKVDPTGLNGYSLALPGTWPFGKALWAEDLGHKSQSQSQRARAKAFGP